MIVSKGTEKTFLVHGDLQLAPRGVNRVSRAFLRGRGRSRKQQREKRSGAPPVQGSVPLLFQRSGARAGAERRGMRAAALFPAPEPAHAARNAQQMGEECGPKLHRSERAARQARM